MQCAEELEMLCVCLTESGGRSSRGILDTVPTFLRRKYTWAEERPSTWNQMSPERTQEGEECAEARPRTGAYHIMTMFRE